MIIECPSCHSRYQYDEDRFERKTSKKIKCARCREVFEIHNPAFAEKSRALSGDTTGKFRQGTPSSVPTSRRETAAVVPAPDPVNRAPLGLPAGRRLSLAVLGGPDAGTVFRIEKPKITIGRAGADLTLTDEDASRVHAGIEIHDTLFLLADLGSTNGTLVGGEKISGEVELGDKAEFQVGGSTIMLIVTEDA